MFQKFVYSPLALRPRRVWTRIAWVECDVMSITVFDSRLKAPAEYIFEVRFLRWRLRLRRPSGKEAIA